MGMGGMGASQTDAARHRGRGATAGLRHTVDRAGSAPRSRGPAVLTTGPAGTGSARAATTAAPAARVAEAAHELARGGSRWLVLDCAVPG